MLKVYSDLLGDWGYLKLSFCPELENRDELHYANEDFDIDDAANGGAELEPGLDNLPATDPPV